MLQCLSVPATGTASPTPACHLLLARRLDTLLGASRGVCFDWKGTGTGWSGTGGSGNFPNPRWPGSLPPSPQRPCPVAGLLELEEREWSAVGCVEACCWVGTRLPHPFWCAGRALLHHPWSLCSGFAASWAPGGGTLPVFQKTVNHFILLGLPIADLDSPGCPSCLSVQALKTPVLLHDARMFCLLRTAF